jgi:2'-hydroxyisoflavone reductase
VQFIDARDLGRWTLDMIAQNRSGIYHATGPDYVLTMGRLLDVCRQMTDSDAGNAAANAAAFTWVADAFLEAQEVGAYEEMPLWVPAGADTAGFERVHISKAMVTGLTFRPLVETVRDTLAWAQSRPKDYAWRGGLRPEKEAALLQAWRAQSG